MLSIVTGIYLILLLLRLQEFVPGLKDVPMLLVWLVVCTLVWIGSPRKTLRPPQIALAVWFSIAAIMSLAAMLWWGGIPPVLLYLGPVMLFFVVLIAAAQPLATLQAYMALTVACACVIVLHGYWQIIDGIGWTGLVPILDRITYVGIFEDPNDLGQLLAISLAFSFYFWTRSRFFMRLVLAAVVCWLLYGIYLTDSRGTMLGAVVLVALYGARQYGKVFVAVIGALAIPVLVASTRFGQINASEESAAGRVESWYEGFQMFQHNPLFGVGYGRYTEYNFLTAHNSIVLPMAELGLFGFIPWMGMLWVTGRMLMWMIKPHHVLRAGVIMSEAAIKSESAAAKALFDTAVVFAVTSFFLSQSYKHVLFFVMGLIAARFVHVSRLYADAPTFTVRGEFRSIIMASLVTIFVMWVVTKVLL